MDSVRGPIGVVVGDGSPNSCALDPTAAETRRRVVGRDGGKGGALTVRIRVGSDVEQERERVRADRVELVDLRSKTAGLVDARELPRTSARRRVGAAR